MEGNNNLEASSNIFLAAIGDVNEAFLYEKSDAVYYEYLMNLAPTREQKEVINSLRKDELMQSEEFRRLYTILSGIDISFNPNKKLVMPESYLSGLNESLSRELMEIDYYKSIRDRFPIGAYRDVLNRIIKDEEKHISKLKYLIRLNNKVDSSVLIKNIMRFNENNTDDFPMDDCMRYISPIVNYALEETDDGVSPEYLYEKLILAGMLIGLGKELDDVMEQIQVVESTGESKLLIRSKMSRYFDF